MTIWWNLPLPLVAAYGSFLIAEHFHFSGVIGIADSRLVVGNVGPLGAISPRGREAVTRTGNTSPLSPTPSFSLASEYSGLSLLCSFYPISASRPKSASARFILGRSPGRPCARTGCGTSAKPSSPRIDYFSYFRGGSILRFCTGVHHDTAPAPHRRVESLFKTYFGKIAKDRRYKKRGYPIGLFPPSTPYTSKIA